MDANKKYQELFKQALKAYPQVKKQTVQEETTKLWKMVKSGAKTYDEALPELASKAMKTKSKIGTFWGNLKKKYLKHLLQAPMILTCKVLQMLLIQPL